MTIAGSYDFNLNRDQVIKGALRLLGVISQGQTPDSNQYNDAAEALNVLVKAWEAEGLPIWVIKQTNFSVVAGTASYTIGSGQTVNVAKPLKVYSAWMRETSSGVDVPMYSLTQQQYDMLGNKTSQGTPTQYWYESLLDTGKMYLFPVPDSSTASAKTCYIRYQAPFSDFDATADTPDFPQEWIRALKWGLAAEIAMEYGYPIKDRQELVATANMFKEEALAFTQEEGSYFFQIDRQRM